MKEAFSGVESAFQIPYELNKSTVSLFNPIKPLFPVNPGFPDGFPIFFAGIPYSVMIGDSNIKDLTSTDINVCTTIINVIQEISNTFYLRKCSDFSLDERKILNFVIKTVCQELNKLSSVIEEEILKSFIDLLNTYSDLIIEEGQDAIVNQYNEKIKNENSILLKFFQNASNKRIMPSEAQYEGISEVCQQLLIQVHTLGFFQTLNGDLSFFNSFDVEIFNFTLQTIINPTSETNMILSNLVNEINQFKATLEGNTFSFVRGRLADGIISSLSQIEAIIKSKTEEKGVRFPMPPDNEFPDNFAQILLQIIDSYIQGQESTQKDLIVQVATSLLESSQNGILKNSCNYVLCNPTQSFCDILLIYSLLPYSLSKGVQHFCGVSFVMHSYATKAIRSYATTQLESYQEFIKFMTTVNEVEYKELAKINVAWIVLLLRSITSFATTLIAAADPVIKSDDTLSVETFKALTAFDPFVFDVSKYVEIINHANSAIDVLSKLEINDFVSSIQQLSSLVNPIALLANGIEGNSDEVEKHLVEVSKTISDMLEASLEDGEAQNAKICVFSLAIEFLAYRKLISKDVNDLIVLCTSFCTAETSDSIKSAGDELNSKLKAVMIPPVKPERPKVQIIETEPETPVPQKQQENSVKQITDIPRYEEKRVTEENEEVENTAPPAVSPSTITSLPPPPPPPPPPPMHDERRNILFSKKQKHKPSRKDIEKTEKPKQQINSKISLRSVRQVESARSACIALSKFMKDDSTSADLTLFNTSINDFIDSINGMTDSFYVEVRERVKKIQEEVASTHAKGSKDFENFAKELDSIKTSFVDKQLQDFGLASDAQAEIILMTAKVDALQSQVSKYDLDQGTPLRNFISKEAKKLLKLTRSLAKAAKEQAEYLSKTNSAITNERVLIKSAQQTTDAAQMFFMLLNTKASEDTDFVFKVVAASRGMNAAITGLIINFRALGGNTNITQRMEVLVKAICDDMRAIIERAESEYGPDHDEDLIAKKEKMNAYNLRVAKANAANEVANRKRELEEAEEALKRFNRASSSKSRAQKMRNLEN